MVNEFIYLINNQFYHLAALHASLMQHACCSCHYFHSKLPSRARKAVKHTMYS